MPYQFSCQKSPLLPIYQSILFPWSDHWEGTLTLPKFYHYWHIRTISKPSGTYIINRLSVSPEQRHEPFCTTRKYWQYLPRANKSERIDTALYCLFKHLLKKHSELYIASTTGRNLFCGKEIILLSPLNATLCFTFCFIDTCCDSESKEKRK